MKPTRLEAAIQLESYAWALLKYAKHIKRGDEPAAAKWFAISKQRKAVFSQTRKEYLK